MTEEQFLDHRWQAKNSITQAGQAARGAAGRWCSDDFIEDATAGFARAPMSVRVSPYLLSLIDWSDPYDDPLRIQFIPLASRLLPDHPKLGLDSLHEQDDAPVPGLTHRYADKALFLPLDTCPVYCRFCTRSYAVGVDTEEVEKIHFKVDEERWQRAFAYIASRPELEDIVISGGDAYNLRAEQIERDRRRRCSTMPQHPAHPLRDQGPGGDAAEDPHRRRVDRRAHARRRARAQAAQGGRAPHALQPPERDHRHHRRRR